MDTHTDSTNVTACYSGRSRPVRGSAQAALNLFKTLGDGKDITCDNKGPSMEPVVSSSDSSSDSNSESERDFDSESDSDNRSSTSSCSLALCPSSVKRPRTSVSLAQTANNNPVSSWREAQVNEELGTPISNDPGSGILLDAGRDRTPLGFFLALFTIDIIDSLISSINAYADMKLSKAADGSKSSAWTPIGRHEMYKFMATMISMSMQPKPKISDYWRTTGHHHTPFFRQMFSRNQFQMIYSTMLHVSEVDSEGKAKIEPFVQKLLASFQATFYPFKDLSVDEMVIGYKGCWCHKQYNASKPAKYHIKTFGLCDSITGYVFNLVIYFGKQTSYDPAIADSPSHAVKIVHTLLQPLKASHHIFADRYYTSLPLVEYLLSKGHNYTGTLNIKRSGFPAQLKTQKVEENQPIYHVRDDGKILCVSWTDRKTKKPVHVVTTHGKAVTVTLTERQREVQKPEIIHTYNMCMNGCDRADQKVSYYGMHSRKTVDWWKEMFTWIFEITQVNAHTLYVLSEKPAKSNKSLVFFKNQLVEGLRSLADSSFIPEVSIPAPRQTGAAARRPVSERHTGSHLIDMRETRKHCAYCTRQGKVVHTYYYCTECSDRPHLCPKQCFRKYHESR